MSFVERDFDQLCHRLWVELGTLATLAQQLEAQTAELQRRLRLLVVLLSLWSVLSLGLSVWLWVVR